MPPSLDYTVASARQLSGGGFPYHHLKDFVNASQDGEPKSKGQRVDGKWQDGSEYKPQSSTRRMGNKRLARELTQTMLSNRSRISLVNNVCEKSSGEWNDEDSDMVILLSETMTQRTLQHDKSEEELQVDRDSDIKDRFRTAPKIRVVRPRLCITKCFSRFRSRVHIRRSIGIVPVRLDPQHVDSLSTAFADRIKTFLLSSTHPKESPTDETDLYATTTDQPLSAYLGQPFVNTCITDNNIPGQVVKLQSRHFIVGTAGLRVGECEFFNISPTFQTDLSGMSNANPESQADGQLLQDPKRTLRIEVDADKRPKFTLTFWGDLHPLVKSKCRLGWISNLDVTDAIRKMAIAEHYAHIPCPLITCDGLSHGRPGLLWELTETRERQVNSQHKALPVRKSGQEDEKANQKSPLRLPRKVRPAMNPTRHEDTVLGLIARLREYHASVLVFSTELGVPSTSTRDFGQGSQSVFRLRFVSSDLIHQREDLAHNISAMNQKSLQELGEVFGGVEERMTQILWGKDAKRMKLYCVPVMESRHEDGADGEAIWPRWWVCFMHDFNSQKLWK
jgi:hypothetical protein